MISVAILFYVLAFLFSPLSNYYASGGVLLFIAVGVYAYYLGDFQPIDAINDRVRFLETYTMDFLIFNVVLQKVMIILMITTIIMFTFGLDKLIGKKNAND